MSNTFFQGGRNVLQGGLRPRGYGPGSASYNLESFVEGLLRKSVPQSKVAARLRLNMLCWCTSEGRGGSSQ